MLSPQEQKFLAAFKLSQHLMKHNLIFMSDCSTNIAILQNEGSTQPALMLWKLLNAASCKDTE